jgi:dihydropteroate synthase
MSTEAVFGSLKIGDKHSVRLMGAINVSPESFYKGSVYVGRERIVAAAERMKMEGAEIIDVGAMSTAPYLKTEITAEEEARRLSHAIKAIKERSKVLVSADTTRSSVAEEACKAGADVLNDVSGFKKDPKMGKVAREHGVGVVLMAHENRPAKGLPVERVKSYLSESLEIASKHGIEPRRIVVDPGIGFFRSSPWPWYLWDVSVLRNLRELAVLGRPITVAVSRKSFIGEILKQPRPEERLIGSLAATSIAVLNGAHMIRAHEIPSTLEVVRLTEFVSKATNAELGAGESRSRSQSRQPEGSE